MEANTIFQLLEQNLKVSERSREQFGALLPIGRHDVTIEFIVACDSHHRVTFKDNVPVLELKENVEGTATPEIYFRFKGVNGDYMSSYRPLIGYAKAGDIAPERALADGLTLHEENGTSFYRDRNGRKVQGTRATNDALDQIRDIVGACDLETFNREAMLGQTISIEVYPKPEFKGAVRMEAGYFRKKGTTSIFFKPPKAKEEEAKPVAPVVFTDPSQLPY